MWLSGRVILTGLAASWFPRLSQTVVMTSAANPAVRQEGSATANRRVFSTDAQIPSTSRGDSDESGTDWDAVELAAEKWAKIFRQFLDENLNK